MNIASITSRDFVDGHRSRFPFIPTAIRVWGSLIYCRTWVVQGLVRGGQEEITMLYGGCAADRLYAEERIFSKVHRLTDLGRRPIWGLGALSDKVDADLLFLPAHRLMSRFVSRGWGFFIPNWVSGVVNTDLDYSQNPWRKRLREELRKLRKYRYSVTVTRKSEDVEAFYYSMYLPVLVESHGENATRFTLSFLLRQLLNSSTELLLIKRGGRPVAGSFVSHEQGRARVYAFGVKDADRNLIREGATAACYYHTVEHVREKGCAVLYLGSCRAFLNDGLLLYKKKWGLSLTGASESGHLLSVRRSSKGVATFLNSNPFIYLSGKDLRGAGFQLETGEGLVSSENRTSALSIDGLCGVTVYKTFPKRGTEAMTGPAMRAKIGVIDA